MLIQFQVDPLHRRSSSIRQLMTIISDEKASRTGPKTAINYKYVSDRSEPKVTLTFHDDAELKVHCITYPIFIKIRKKFL